MKKSEQEIRENLSRLGAIEGMSEVAKLLGNIFETSCKQVAMFEELSKKYQRDRTDLEFERNRRTLAEEYISLTPCDHDINEKQSRCYSIWQTTKGAHEMWLRGEL